MEKLNITDPEVFNSIEQEFHRQQNTLEMISSENFTSPNVMEAVGSVLTNKYAEGYPGKRYYGGPIEIIKLSRMHNNANILSFGSRFISHEKAAEVVDLWLSEPFEGGRHQQRIEKLDN